jgi:hypothetical protein
MFVTADGGSSCWAIVFLVGLLLAAPSWLGRIFRGR